MINLDKIEAFFEGQNKIQMDSGKIALPENIDSIKEKFKKHKKRKELLEVTLNVLKSNPLISHEDAVKKAKDIIDLVRKEVE